MLNHILCVFKTKALQGALEEFFFFFSPSYHLSSPKLMYLALLYQNANLLSEQEENYGK